MGGGTWTTDTYTARSTARTAAGYNSAFTHDEDILTGRRAAGVHETLDPKATNSNGAHTGQNIRECMDGDDHPNATPIAVLFDVTGSMGTLPRVLQTKLPQLHGLLQRKGYVEDPQILFGAIGDAHSDHAPLQVGQFESDNRMDENLENIWIESGGGGGNHESYELGAYFIARHTYTDAYELRGKKGYLFLIGDERIYSQINAGQVKHTIGGVSAEFTGPLSTRELFEELKEKWEVFFLFAVGSGSYTVAQVLEAKEESVQMGWKTLLGEHALVLEDADAVCETIALTLGMMEGMVGIDDGMEDLIAIGADESSVKAAGRALAKVGAGASAVATSSGAVPGLDDEDTGTERL